MTVIEALIDAVRCGDLVALRALLTVAPHVVGEARTTTGKSQILSAVARGRLDVASLLAQHVDALDVFEAAAVGHSTRLAAVLDDTPANITAFSVDGWTALHLAAFAGQIASTRRLLDAGSDANIISANSMASAPLHTATSGAAAPAVVSLLLERGAHPSGRAAGGITPLHNAAARGVTAVADLLLAHGADPAALMETGQSPAMIAAAKGHSLLARRIRDAERAK
ncbi:MAG TPA: ankyrin repeat domain-containing protein [Gemmatimonadaceae bacterium]|nr:ankyrin repeat domain-containing protein [Gemmatimonadaceae bacterium]